MTSRQRGREKRCEARSSTRLAPQPLPPEQIASRTRLYILFLYPICYTQAELRTMTQTTAAEETQDGFEDPGIGGGPGAPTPLSALEVSCSIHDDACKNILTGYRV